MAESPLPDNFITPDQVPDISPDPRSPETLMYEATIEDPKTFSKPWKISMPLYKHVEPNAQLMEYKCPEFAEEVLYGHLRKKPLTTPNK